MSLVPAVITSVLILGAAWLGLTRRHLLALVTAMAAVIPLLLDTSTVRAIFIWLGLIGPICMIAVMLGGMQNDSRRDAAQD